MRLNQYEIEDIEDCLAIFEQRFQIKLENIETQKLNTFSAFSELIVSKIKFKTDNICTTQRAFYQFRKALAAENVSNLNQIRPSTDLESIFPKKNRRKMIKNIERTLGYEIAALAPSQLTSNILFFGLVFSIIGLFVAWQISIFGVLFSIIGLYFTKFTNRLDKQNLRTLIEKYSTEHYLTIRSGAHSFNPFEFKTVILEWFSENTGIPKEKLRQATFA
jgi:hypothetical protein